MKTITMDYNLYLQEVNDKYNDGIKMGFWKAKRAIENGGKFPFYERCTETTELEQSLSMHWRRIENKEGQSV